jgi:hypothetical protein
MKTSLVPDRAGQEYVFQRKAGGRKYAVEKDSPRPVPFKNGQGWAEGLPVVSRASVGDGEGERVTRSAWRGHRNGVSVPGAPLIGAAAL